MKRFATYLIGICLAALTGCDVHEWPEKAEEVAKISDAQIYVTGKELIEQADVDIIDICLPTYLHAKFALSAMEKVKYLFVEKPLALDLDLGIAGIVKHLSCLLGKIRNIAGIQADAALGDALGLQHLVEDLDSIRNTRLDNVIGIYQKRSVIGVYLAICLERFIFAIEHLHPGVRHSTA